MEIKVIHLFPQMLKRFKNIQHSFLIYANWKIEIYKYFLKIITHVHLHIKLILESAEIVISLKEETVED